MNITPPLPMLDEVGPSVSWPELMATCERLGRPAMRIDAQGRAYLLRAVADLDEWQEESA